MKRLARFACVLLLLSSSIADVRTTLAQANSHDPSAVKFESVSRVGGSTYSLALQGSTAYVQMGTRVAIFDLAEPANPRLLGQTSDQPEGIQDFAVDGEYLYLALYAAHRHRRVHDGSNVQPADRRRG